VVWEKQHCSKKSKGIVKSLYGMLTVQKWCRLQVAPKHLGRFFLDL